MIDYKAEKRGVQLKSAVNKLRLKFPVSEISKKTGYGTGTISKYLKGDLEPSFSFISKFEEVYGLSIDDFKEEERKTNPLSGLENVGKGDSNKEVEKTAKIPFYEDAIMIGGKEHISDMGAVTIHNEMIDAGDWFRDATGAMRVHGNSMYPNYPSGSIVAFKQVNDIALLLYGQDYMIETIEYRVIKRVQKSERADNLMLCSYNNEKDERGGYIHENFDVGVDKINRIFRILGKVERTESSRIVYNKK